MILNQKRIESKCCFYVSDFHLEMTILPYINENLNKYKSMDYFSMDVIMSLIRFDAISICLAILAT